MYVISGNVCSCEISQSARDDGSGWTIYVVITAERAQARDDLRPQLPLGPWEVAV